MKKITIEIKWGVLFSIAALVWMIFENSIGLHDKYISKQALYTNLFGLIAILIYGLAIREKKYLYFKGTMNWQQGFISGVVLSIVISFISPMVQYITYTLITPNFFTNFINYAVANNIQTQAQAEAYFSIKSYMIQSIFGSFSTGIIMAAIVAFFLKTKNNTH